MTLTQELIEACQAGARYSNALKAFQDRGTTGMIDGTDQLDELFEDWHDKTHAVLEKCALTEVIE